MPARARALRDAGVGVRPRLGVQLRDRRALPAVQAPSSSVSSSRDVKRSRSAGSRTRASTIPGRPRIANTTRIRSMSGDAATCASPRAALSTSGPRPRRTAPARPRRARSRAARVLRSPRARNPDRAWSRPRRGRPPRSRARRRGDPARPAAPRAHLARSACASTHRTPRAARRARSARRARGSRRSCGVHRIVRRRERGDEPQRRGQIEIVGSSLRTSARSTGVSADQACATTAASCARSTAVVYAPAASALGTTQRGHAFAGSASSATPPLPRIVHARPRAPSQSYATQTGIGPSPVRWNELFPRAQRSSPASDGTGTSSSAFANASSSFAPAAASTAVTKSAVVALPPACATRYARTARWKPSSPTYASNMRSTSAPRPAS